MSEERPDPTPDVPRAERVAAWVLGLAIAAVVGTRLTNRAFQYLHWSDRDLWRTAAMGDHFPVTGAELSFGAGGRLPGGAFHYVLAPPVFLHGSPVAAYAWMILLDLLGLLALAFATRRWIGPWGAAVAVAAYVGSDTTAESLHRLWNPGFETSFLLAAAALVLADARAGTARRLPWVGLLVGIAAQMHLSAIITGVGHALGLALVRARHLLKGLAGALLAFLATYLPYVIVDGLRGWENTRALLIPAQVSDLTAMDAAGIVDALDGAAGYLAGGRTPRALAVTWSNTFPADWDVVVLGLRGMIALGMAVCVVGLVARVATPRTRADALRVLVPVGLPFLLGLAYFARSDFVNLQASGASRYLLAFIPSWALLMGAGAVWARRAVAHHPARHAVGFVVTAGLLVQLAAAQSYVAVSHVELQAWNQLDDTLEAVEAETGWTLAEAAGRVTAFTWRDERWTWSNDVPVAHLLQRRGEVPAGALPPPCAVLLLRRRTSGHDRPRPTDADLARELAQPVEVLDTVQLPHGHDLVRYRPTRGPCPSNLDQRYVELPVERQVHRALSVAEPGTVVPLEAPPGTTRVGAVVGEGRRTDRPPMPRILVGVDLVPDGDRLRITLHSNQLRGQAWNQGWLAMTVAERPTVVLEGDDGTERVVLAEGLVGLRGARAPFTATAPRPTGPVTVRLELAQLVDDDPFQHWPIAPLPTFPLSVTLLQDWTPPDGR